MIVSFINLQQNCNEVSYFYHEMRLLLISIKFHFPSFCRAVIHYRPLYNLTNKKILYSDIHRPRKFTNTFSHS